MLENNFDKPNMEKKPTTSNCPNAAGHRIDIEGPPIIHEVIRSRKCLLKINELWFIMICEKRRRRPIDMDSDEVVIITVE